METFASNEAVAFALWRIIRDTHAGASKQSVDSELALFSQCLETVRSKKPMQIKPIS